MSQDTKDKDRGKKEAQSRGEEREEDGLGASLYGTSGRRKVNGTSKQGSKRHASRDRMPASKRKKGVRTTTERNNK